MHSLNILESPQRRDIILTLSLGVESRGQQPSLSSESAETLEGGWVMKGAESSRSKGASAAVHMRKDSEDSHYRPLADPAQGHAWGRTFRTFGTVLVILRLQSGDT